MKRTFTIASTVDVKLPEDGSYRYEASAPYAAAGKAARRIFQEIEKQNIKKRAIKFTIRETTQGSAQKTFTYTATKRELSTPKVVMLITDCP